MKYKAGFLVHFKKFPLFTFNDANLFLSDKGASPDYIRRFISLMLRKGQLYRITKGYYTLNRSDEIVGYAFKPFYYGLGFALTRYRLSKQQANPTILTTKKVRPGVREIFGRNVVIENLPLSLYFGYDDVEGGMFHFYLSDVEKTLLDMLYFDYVVEDYVYRNILKQIDRRKMDRYLKRYDKETKIKYDSLTKKYENST